MRSHLNKALHGARPRRGSPADTRERLVASAARLFNQVGYHGTDSNGIAKEAGYSTGVFYKHFQNKREIFLAAYQTWVASEWGAVGVELSSAGSREAVARRLVALSVKFHTKWRGLRASLIELVFTDAKVRRFYRDQRRRQLDLMAELRVSLGTKRRGREWDAVHLYTIERACDAMAQGELRDLGLSLGAMVEVLVKRVVEALT